MAFISDLATGLRIVSGAARSLLSGSDGATLTRASVAARSPTDEFVPFGGVNDDNWRAARMDRTGGLAMAWSNLLFSEPFEGAVVSAPNRLNVTNASFTAVQSSAGGYNINSSLITTVGAAHLIATSRQFPKFQRAPLHLKTRVRFAHVANAVMEIGFGLPSLATLSPTVGAYWQVTAGGAVQGVLTFNGVDQTTSAIMLPGGWQSNFYTVDVILDDDEAIFIIQDTATGLVIAERRIQMSITQVRLWNASHLPVFARCHFPTAPATAANMVISSIDVMLLDANVNKPWAHSSALMGLGGDTNPTTFAQVANYTNALAPGNAALSNTAAGYNTLGGQFQFVAVAGAETDYALFGFTVPAPYSFVCTDIDIDVFNMGAANSATVPTLLQWFVSPDQTAISLAIGNNRRTTLGTNSIPINAVIGQNGDRPVQGRFGSAPLVTHGGRIMVLGLKIPVGAATASQIIRGTAAIKGYFE